MLPKAHQSTKRVASFYVLSLLLFSLPLCISETCLGEELWKRIPVEEVSVKKLAADELTGEYIIFLENKKTRKVFPIWIAVQEALVIY